MVCTPDILLKNDCTNFNLKKRTAPEKKVFLIISLITINNSWNYVHKKLFSCNYTTKSVLNATWAKIFPPHVFFTKFFSIFEEIYKVKASQDKRIFFRENGSIFW